MPFIQFVYIYLSWGTATVLFFIITDIYIHRHVFGGTVQNFIQKDTTMKHYIDAIYEHTGGAVVFCIFWYLLNEVIRSFIREIFIIKK